MITVSERDIAVLVAAGKRVIRRGDRHVWMGGGGKLCSIMGLLII